jgi:hypothetical protein
MSTGKLLGDLGQRFLVNFFLFEFAKFLAEGLQAFEEIGNGDGGAPHAPGERLIEGQVAKASLFFRLISRTLASARRHNDGNRAHMGLVREVGELTRCKKGGES